MLAEGVSSWGKIYKPDELTIHWHVPSRPEIEFAVSLFDSQAGGAVQALHSLTTGSAEITRDGTGKEWSDEVTRNLALLRLALSGISILFDSQYMSGGEPASKTPTLEEEEGGSPDQPLGESGEEECQPTRRYPAGYTFKSSEDPLYIQVHELRDRIGRMLHQVHQFLTSKQEDDVACFNALYTVRYPNKLFINYY